MARSNTANSGTSFFDLDIQTVSVSASTIVLRAVIYLTSRNVVDSVNTLSVWGNWSRGGALALNGVYNAVPVWYQDQAFGRGGSDYWVSVSASWATVEYWGVTLSASNQAIISAATPTVTPPGAPIFVSNSATQNVLRLSTSPGPNNGAGQDLNHLRVWTQGYDYYNPNVFAADVAWWDWGVNVPWANTRYFWGVASHNVAGWGPPSNTGANWYVDTRETAYANVGGTWRPTRGYANVGGTWRDIIEAYVNVNGTWRTW